MERASIGPHALKEVNKRQDWMKQWLMIQNITALNTMRRKTLGKQDTYRSTKGTEKQLDYILIKRRHLRYSKDAEANDMIHMGSDHRCVIATFVINARKKRTAPAMHITTENITAQTDKKEGHKEAYVQRKRSGTRRKDQTKSCSRKV